MRVLKIKGGLTRGRGMTEQTLEKFYDAFQETTLIIEAFETFSKLNLGSSEQHKDLRESSIKRY